MSACSVIIEGRMCVSAEMHSLLLSYHFISLPTLERLSSRKLTLLKIPAKPTARMISEVHFSFGDIIQRALLKLIQFFNDIQQIFTGWYLGFWEIEYGCGRLNSGPQRCPHLHPGTCEFVTLHGKRNFTDVNKVRISRWRACPALAG